MNTQFLAAGLLLVSPASIAGEITLVSETWDFICEVEVATGLQSPESPDETIEISGVKADSTFEGGVIFTGFDRLCYRRSSTADDCYSPLNEWTCYTNTTDTVEVVNIF